ncbi:uncharacterized protein K444DRAFT_707411, partial [Hyaloscypha bicolor E]
LYDAPLALRGPLPWGRAFYRARGRAPFATGKYKTRRLVFGMDGPETRHFLDYRNETHPLRSRDPIQRYYIGPSPAFSFYDAMIEYDAIPQSAAPLSVIPGRKYGLSIVLDTADGRIVVLDTQGPGNSDPLILNQNWEKMPEEYRIGTKYYGTEVFARYGYFGFPWVEQKQCDKDSLEEFNGKGFDIEMRKLRHKIEVQYMPDLYCLVPREQEAIDAMKRWGGLDRGADCFC